MSSTTGSSGKAATLYVGNLAPGVTEARLLAHFSAAGAVSSVKICRNRKAPAGQYTACGFVRFRRKEDASRALDSMNSTLICGRPVRVMWAQNGAPTPEAAVGVLIKGLNCDSEELYDTYSAFGTVKSHKLFVDIRGTCNVYGYVQYDSEEEVDYCIGVIKASTSLAIVKLFPNVQVRNFGDGLNGSTLRDMFCQYGEIHEHRVVSNGGSTRGLAYVTYRSLESAARAIVALDSKDFGPWGKISVVSAPQPTHLTLSDKTTKKRTDPESTTNNRKSKLIERLRNLREIDHPEAPLAKHSIMRDQLYLKVKALNASMAGVVTSKLLEAGTPWQRLMTNPAALKAKVDETVVALLLGREQHLQQIASRPAGSAAA